MSAQRLLEGYRSILKRIYAPEAYYERVRQFLDQCRPTNRVRRTLSILYRHAFGPAVTLAIMGYHFAAVTEEVCQAD